MISRQRQAQRSGTIYVRNLDWPAPENTQALLPADFVRVGPASLPALAEAMGSTGSKEASERLSAGRTCYAALVEGKIAAYGWVSFGEEQIGEMHMRIHLKPGEVYIWDCATLAQYRRQRLYTGLLVHITGDLPAQGVCRAWIGTDWENVSSQRGILRAGFRPVADITHPGGAESRPVRFRSRPGTPARTATDLRQALVGDLARIS